MEPKLAAEDAISRIARKFPNFVGAVFAVSEDGIHAGACHGWTFQYSVRLPNMDDVEVFTITPPIGRSFVSSLSCLNSLTPPQVMALHL